MANEDKGYFARRAAEEAELARVAQDPSAAAAHRLLQRGYAERASIGERQPASEPTG
ncbi:MAG: hypothetical protein M3Q88_07660 [Pseudomonadota bacterium]|nr:hypothetical protein [Pseudomonadota bacterium]